MGLVSGVRERAELHRRMWKEVSQGHSGQGEGQGTRPHVRQGTDRFMVWWMSLRSVSPGAWSLPEGLGGSCGTGEEALPATTPGWGHSLDF